MIESPCEQICHDTGARDTELVTTMLRISFWRAIDNRPYGWWVSEALYIKANEQFNMANNLQNPAYLCPEPVKQLS